jgi:hypothetical protein
MVTNITRLVLVYCMAFVLALLYLPTSSVANSSNSAKFNLTLNLLDDSFEVGDYIEAEVIIQPKNNSQKKYDDVALKFIKQSGDGHILFQTNDQPLQSNINEATFPITPGKLPAKKTYTFKFEKHEDYTIDVQLVDRKKNKILAQTTKTLRTSPSFQNLGVQIQNTRIGVSSFGKDALGRETNYTVVQGNPAKLVGTLLENEEVVVEKSLTGATGSWAVTVATDGKVYTGTWPNGHLYQFNPQTDSVTDLGQVENETMIWDLKAGPNGSVFGGTNPNAILFSYEPNEGIKSFGSMSSEDHIKNVAYDRHTNSVYAGVGLKAHLMKYDLGTNQKTEVLPQLTSGFTSVYDLQAYGGKLFVRLEPDFKVRVLDAATLEIEHEVLAHSRGVSPLSPDGKKVYFTQLGKLFEYNLETKTSSPVLSSGLEVDLKANVTGFGYVQLNNPDYPGYSLAGTLNNSGDYFVYNLEKQTLKISKFPLPAQSTDIFSIGTGNDGKIYSGGFLAGGIGAFDPLTGTSVNLGDLSQTEGMTSLGNQMYFGTYPGAVIHAFDTTRPWKRKVNPLVKLGLANHGQLRPVALLGVEERNKLFIGTTPNEGTLGGAFTVYDPATSDSQVFTNIIPNQSVISLTYLNGKVYGGTSIFGGSGASPISHEGKIFVWDDSLKQKTDEYTPVLGKSAIVAMTVGPDQKIYGFAQGTLFVLNPETGQTEYTKDIFPEVYIERTGATLLTGTDGFLYGTMGGKLFQIDPLTKNITILKEDNTFRLAQDHQGNLYFKNSETLTLGDQLYRYARTDSRIKVTGIQVESKEVELKSGDTFVASVNVLPEFSTNQKVAWTSSNVSVASVDSTGTITAKATGAAKIQVISEDGGFSEEISITVK